jgi:hypothetical protein
MVDLLDKVEDQMTRIYMKKTGLSDVEVAKMLSKETWLTSDEAIEMGLATSKVEDEDNTNIEYYLSNNFPNPFNPITNISFILADEGYTELKIFDVVGNTIQTLIQNELNAGRYNIQFNAGKLSSGIYLYRLSVNDYSETKKMVLIK